MPLQETAIAKLRQLPDPLTKLVIEFIDFFLAIPNTTLSPTTPPTSSDERPPVPQNPRTPVSARGLITIPPDFDAPLDDFREYVERPFHPAHSPSRGRSPAAV